MITIFWCFQIFFIKKKHCRLPADKGSNKSVFLFVEAELFDQLANGSFDCCIGLAWATGAASKRRSATATGAGAETGVGWGVGAGAWALEVPWKQI